MTLQEKNHPVFVFERFQLVWFGFFAIVLRFLLVQKAFFGLYVLLFHVVFAPLFQPEFSSYFHDEFGLLKPFLFFQRPYFDALFLFQAFFMLFETRGLRNGFELQRFWLEKRKPLPQVYLLKTTPLL